MYFFIEKSNYLKTKAEELNLDYNDIYVNSIQKIYSELNLPPLHESGDGFLKGDATVDQLSDLAFEVNMSGDAELYFEIDPETGDIVTDLFEYLDARLLEIISDNIDSQIRLFGNQSYTKEQFETYKYNAEALIKDFLNREYYFEPKMIGHDWSLFFIADEMKCFEMVQASSNWMFHQDNDARFRIAHLNNYQSPFEECDYHLDNGCKCNNDLVIEFEIPDVWDEIPFNEKLVWFLNRHVKVIEECQNNKREEAIDNIINFIEWNEIESWFNKQFN